MMGSVAGPDKVAIADYAVVLLRALVRDEVAGRRPPRLSEPGLATWQRFRGRLGSADLLRLVVEDGAVVHPVPFGTGWLEHLDDAVVDRFLATVSSISAAEPSVAYIEDQARRLGVFTRLARAELHQVKSHQKVLELPGTGGQLSHYLVTTQAGLTLQQNCTIACDGWAELTLAGVAALEVGAPGSGFIVSASPDDLKNPEHPLRKGRFDFVFGLRPDKGGKFVVADQLALWFHGATVVLV